MGPAETFGVLFGIIIWIVIITTIVKLFKTTKGKVKEFSQSGKGERIISASKNFVAEVSNKSISSTTTSANDNNNVYDLTKPKEKAKPKPRAEIKQSFVSSKAKPLETNIVSEGTESLPKTSKNLKGRI